MRIYCSGIGGIGLSGYAALQRARGHMVSGSDQKDGAILQDLRTQGVVVTLAQDGSALSSNVDLFVYSEAIPPDHPERQRASVLNIPALSYFQALAEIARDFAVIAVCGTHGKSSTTAMAARLLLNTGRDPTIIVGTKVPELHGRNWHMGRGRIFLVEACEYRCSFHAFSPQYILMTNVDGDHFDAFPSLTAYQDAFVAFLRSLDSHGSIVTHMNDPDCAKVTFASGRSFFDADALSLPVLRVPGRHMQENAQLVLGLASVLGIPLSTACSILADFSGTWRRMELRGEWMQDILLVDDYAHHPREIRATLRAMREAYPARRLLCVFQPHTHCRLSSLYEDFCHAFSDAASVVLCPVFEARGEMDDVKVDMQRFAQDLARDSGVRVIFGGEITDLPVFLSRVAQPGDLLLTMGAGDITRVPDMLLTSSGQDPQRH